MASEYELFVDDDHHYMDESARSPAGRFATYEGAVKAAERIVDGYLREAHEPGMTPEQLLGSYTMFGEDPFIRVPAGAEPPEEPFSARKYAERRCREICRG